MLTLCSSILLPPLRATEARGRGGAKDGRGVRNHRSYSRSSSTERPMEKQVSFERPIRCANMHYGGFCGTYNYVEAPYCSGCWIAYPNGLPRGPIAQRSRGGYDRQVGMGLSRPGKWGAN